MCVKRENKKQIKHQQLNEISISTCGGKYVFSWRNQYMDEIWHYISQTMATAECARQ